MAPSSLQMESDDKGNNKLKEHIESTATINFDYKEHSLDDRIGFEI